LIIEEIGHLTFLPHEVSTNVPPRVFDLLIHLFQLIKPNLRELKLFWKEGAPTRSDKMRQRVKAGGLKAESTFRGWPATSSAESKPLPRYFYSLFVSEDRIKA
jgi:hypothetical protein